MRLVAKNVLPDLLPDPQDKQSTPARHARSGPLPANVASVLNAAMILRRRLAAESLPFPQSQNVDVDGWLRSAKEGRQKSNWIYI